VSLSEQLALRAQSTSAYDGVDVAEAYGDVDLEWAALDGSAALVDTSFRRTIGVTGEERRQFLQGQVSHSLATVKQGAGVPALLLNAQGRVLSIVPVYDAGETFELNVEEANVEATLARLEQFLIADDAELALDEPQDRFSVVGPDALMKVAAMGVDVPMRAESPAFSGPWFVRRARIGGADVALYGRGDLRVPAVEVVEYDAGGAEAAWRAFESAGVHPAGSRAYEVMRIESGTPRMGVDVDEGRVALEARLEWAIHFRKGCYVGQEIIERAVSRGRVGRLLTLLATESLAQPGDLVQSTGTKETVTSAAVSPRLGPICLAYVVRELAEPGKQLTLYRGNVEELRARVLPWPRAEVYAGR
jgi:aminomethyltransferase